MSKQETDRKRAITLVDCTLREGEQTPGLSFTPDEKVEILTILERLDVPLVDAGMPAVSKEEFDTLCDLVRRAEKIRVAASIRARRDEIELAQRTEVREIFLIFPSSPLHIQHKFAASETDVLDEAGSLVELAVGKGMRVNLVAEDSSRAEMEFLVPLCKRAREAGAGRIFLCDTVGIMRPSAMAAFVKDVIAEVGLDIEYGAHCHNDFGLATANTVAAMEAGVTCPTVTINGIGERCGNAPLHEITLIVEKLFGRQHWIDLAWIREASETVERISGILIPQLAPLVGFNAFRHESGIHVDGLLKDSRMYEPFAPGQIGVERTYVIGKQTGRAHIRHLLDKLGIDVDAREIDKICERIKDICASTEPARQAFSRLKEDYIRYNRSYRGISEEDFVEMAREVIKGFRVAS